ncbi:hypothetical protein L218DRAFT_1054800 [Marasmius fiardii PR-910]|nr:hypothetical protein L218DRAFT_1054800 [Marasmius fiardii PR-910]
MVKGWIEGIGALLVFVRVRSSCSHLSANSFTGWFVFCCRHRVHGGIVTVVVGNTKRYSHSVPHLVATTPGVQKPSAPSSSSLRINCVRFLSLVLSFTYGLCGLMCKQ